MTKYKKKPIIIEAIQFRKGYFESDETPQDFKNAVCREHHIGMIDPPRPHIHTLEGNHYVIVNDWIIRGIKDEFYPCKPDIFKATYSLSNR